MGSAQESSAVQPRYKEWLRGPLLLVSALMIARFVLEAAGVSKDITRYISASVGGSLILFYLGAVAPLRGITRFRQLALPTLVWTAWVGGLDAVILTVSGLFRLPGSHFADAPGAFQNWGHFGLHVLSHFALILVAYPIDLGLLALLVFLYRWPVIVGPSAILGGIVTLRFAAEAMHFAPTTASAWSSTVGILISALYLGGAGARTGYVSARQLLAPSLALGLVWRAWIFLAVLASATGLYRTHFFDPSQGQVGLRLLESFGVQVAGGAVAGLLVWGIAAWTFRATRPMAEA